MTIDPESIDSASIDPVTLEVYRHLFTALAEEMGAALRRAAFSPNIKERRDYSCALFDPDGTGVAMGDHMPVHLGAMPMSVAAALEELEKLAPGDVVCLNDPFRGGTHLPDITLVAPVYAVSRADRVAEPRSAGTGGSGGMNVEVTPDESTDDDSTLLGYVAARAHHADVGGSTPGSMPLAREIYEEGVRIPPVRIVESGRKREDIWRLILANVRTPDERAGDLDAQLAALHAGRLRLLELVERRGEEEVLSAMKALIRYADRMVVEGLGRIPAGRYEAEDVVRDDGFGNGPLPIHVTLEIESDHLVVDFSGTAEQTAGGVNAVAAITSSATRYVIRCVIEALLSEALPAGGGSMSAVELRLPERSLVDASPPASVAAGNVETSQRITDVLLQALGEALPDLIPALSQGTMNNTTVGGTDPRTGKTFAYYETVGGGMGAGPSGPGLSGVHTHMSNSLNTPIEALEHAYPFRVSRYGIRRGTGGNGRHRGGDGLRRDLLFLGEARVTLLSERRRSGPSGARGGGPGAPGENVLIRAKGTRKEDVEEEMLPGKVTLDVGPGDVISVRSPGGGGWGRAPAPPGADE